MQRVAVSMGIEGGLVVYDDHAGRRTTVSLDRAGRPAGDPASIPGAAGSSIVALRSLGSAHALLIEESCDELAPSRRCLRLIAFDPNGHPRARSEPLAMSSALHSLKVLSNATTFWVAWSQRGAPSMLGIVEASGQDESFRLKTRIVELALDDHERPPASSSAAHTPQDLPPAEIVALAADDARWAVLWRTGPVEDMRTRIVLSSAKDRARAHHAVFAHGDDHSVHGEHARTRSRLPEGVATGALAASEEEAAQGAAELDHLLVVESLAMDDEGLSFIGSFEFARPVRFRLAWDGRMLEAPRTIGAGDSPGVGLRERRHVSLERGNRELALRRRGPAGYPIGAPLPIATSAIGFGGADITSVEGGYWIAYASGARLFGVRVRCSDR